MDWIEPEKVQVDNGHVAVFRKNNYLNKTLVFVHGNSLSARIWEKQFSSQLNEHYNLLAIDLPGHGQSAWLAHPEKVYSLQYFSTILLKIIGHYQLKNFMLVGHSLGGHIVLEALPKAFGCLSALVIGTPPLNKPFDFSKAFLPNPHANCFFSADAAAAELREWAKTQFHGDAEQIPSFIEEDYRNTDPNLRIFLGANTLQGLYENEVQIIAETQVPVTIALGKEDQFISLSYLLSMPLKSTLHHVLVIPAAGHMAPYENPVFINNFLVQLLYPESIA